VYRISTGTGAHEKFRGAGYKSSTGIISGYRDNTVGLGYSVTVLYRGTGVQEIYRCTRLVQGYSSDVVQE
jgi:hypothetical protein